MCEKNVIQLFDSLKYCRKTKNITHSLTHKHREKKNKKQTTNWSQAKTPTHLPTRTCKTHHLCHTHTALHTTTPCAKQMRGAMCVLKQIIQERNRSQIQQLLSNRASRLIRAARRPVTPNAPSHSRQREHSRVSLCGHELFHVHVSLSTCSRHCEDRVKGLWLTKPLIPQQPRSLWSASLWRRENHSSLDTFSHWAFLLWLPLTHFLSTSHSPSEL